MTTVLLISGMVIYLTTAVVVAYGMRAFLLSRPESSGWSAGPALVVGWFIGLLWPLLLLFGLFYLIFRGRK